jgi:hypothetical protein
MRTKAFLARPIECNGIDDSLALILDLLGIINMTEGMASKVIDRVCPIINPAHRNAIVHLECHRILPISIETGEFAGMEQTQYVIVEMSKRVCITGKLILLILVESEHLYISNLDP